MRSVRVQVSFQFKHEFWEVVADCLVEFHGSSSLRAKVKSKKLRARIEAPPPNIDSEVFYHNEPFDIAYDIAELPSNVQEGLTKAQMTKRQKMYLQYRQQYERILMRHKWR